VQRLTQYENPGYDADLLLPSAAFSTCSN